MKKTILVVLMVVMIATPCFAQGVETDGLFSIVGTEWRCIGVAVYFGFPFWDVLDYTVYFTERSVESSSRTIGILQNVDTYRDFLIFSVAWYRSFSRPQETDGSIMILQPALGVGTFSAWTRYYSSSTERLHLGRVGFGFMFKIDNN